MKVTGMQKEICTSLACQGNMLGSQNDGTLRAMTAMQAFPTIRVPYIVLYYTAAKHILHSPYYTDPEPDAEFLDIST